MKMARRNKKGEVVKGRGSELTTLQSEFLERVADEGMENSSRIARDLNDTNQTHPCLLYTSPSPRDGLLSRMPSSA